MDTSQRGGATRTGVDREWNSPDCEATWGELEDDEQSALERELARLRIEGALPQQPKTHCCTIPTRRKNVKQLDIKIEYANVPKLGLVARFVVTCLTCREVPTYASA